MLAYINLQKSSEYENSPQLLSHEVQRTFWLLWGVSTLKDQVSPPPFFSLRDAEKEEAEKASVVLRFFVFRIAICVPPRQEHREQARNLMYRQAYYWPKKKVWTSFRSWERSSTFPRPLLLSWTLSCSQGYSSFENTSNLRAPMLPTVPRSTPFKRISLGVR